MNLLPALTRVALAASLALSLPALAEEAQKPPRLSDLAPAADAPLTETRKVTQIGQYAATRVMQLQLKAGSEMPSHAAPERVLVIVLSGEGHFDFSGEIVPLHERQVLHMAPGEPHGVVAKTDMELLLVRIDESDHAAAKGSTSGQP